MADMIVSGAGTSAVNGTYVENGTSNGKPKYTYGNYELGVYYVYAIGGNNWVIRTISSPYTTYYSNFAGNVPDTPDLASSWRKEYGASPTPTVTAASSSQNLTLSCAAGSYSQTGVACTLTYTPAAQNLTLSCGAGSYSLTGSSVTFEVKRNYTLACDAGSYTITGTNADITSSRTLSVGGAYPDIIVSGAGTTDANGTYVYEAKWDGKPFYTNGDNSILWYDNKWTIINAFESGNRYESTDDVATPDLVTTWVVNAGIGAEPVPTVTAAGTNAYTLTGSDVTLTYTQGAQNLTLACNAGSYALTGSDVSFGNTKAYSLTCEAGAYTLTGSSVSFVIQRNYSLACETGSYSLTGTDATCTILRNYILACGTGSYTLNGTNTGLTSARIMALASGSYALTGTDADLFKGLVLPCASGSYALTGTDASLTSHRIFALGVGGYVLVGTSVGLFILSPTPACRTATIEYENRTFAIPHENRTATIEYENRTLEVKCH